MAALQAFFLNPAHATTGCMDGNTKSVYTVDCKMKGRHLAMNRNMMSLFSYELFESLYLERGSVSCGKNTALIRRKN